MVTLCLFSFFSRLPESHRKPTNFLNSLVINLLYILNHTLSICYNILMSFKIGIVGLPNVGKSTLFNALTKQQAQASNFPFTTIDPNVGVINVPDERLAKLSAQEKSAKIVPTSIEFIDIAGLVKGAAEGAGLGNKFLSHIREVDAIVQVVRFFKNDEIIHVDGSVDPARDMEVINLELLLIDVKIESELAELADDERAEYMKELGISESGLDRLARASYKLLNLITYFTAGPIDTNAWTIVNGTKAPQAAGVIHTDFEKGFIKAEVISWDKLLEAGSYAAARDKGWLRLEGKEYVIADGDVAHFRVNT